VKVQLTGRLVGEKQRIAGGESPRDRNALLFAAPIYYVVLKYV